MQQKTITLKVNRQLSIESNPTVIYQNDNKDLNRYEAVAAFMKEIEMTPPDEVVTLNLRFEGDDSNGTNS